ncbi:MAG: tetratricopeptide repeat protein [Planctomycetes bacterium]|nr:tetratricopeptide repeat protein [Planctomycetota bacterium]
MQLRRRFLLALLAAALAAGAVLALSRPKADPLRRAVREAIARMHSGEIERAVHAADLAFRASDGIDGTAELSSLARALAGDLPTALARIESAARRDTGDAESALAAGLLARCISRTARNGPELRRCAREWFDEAVRRVDAAPDSGRAPGGKAFAATAVAVAARLAEGDASDAKRRLVAMRAAPPAEAAQAAILGAAADAALGDFNAAAATLKAAAAAAPSERLSSALARIQSWRVASGEPPLVTGLRAWAEGDARATAVSLERWIAQHPADPVALCVLATALARLDDGPSVVRCAELLRAAAPHGPAEPYFLGCHLLASGRADDSAWMLTLASQRAPGDEHVLRALAASHIERNQPLDAARACREWLARCGPDQPTAVAAYFLAVSLEATGDDVGAESALRRVLTAAPTDAAAVDRLADLLVRTGRAPEAASLMQTAVDSTPGSSQLRVRLAVTLLAIDRRDDAERLLREVARDDPGCASAHSHLGRMLAARCGARDGDRADAAIALEATAAFETAVRLDPDAIDARLGLIGLARTAGGGPDAIRVHRATLREESARRPSAALSFALGAAAEIAGDFDDAEVWSRDALRREPRLGIASNNLAWLLAVRRRSPAEALPFADDAVRRLPRSPQALDTRGWIRYLLRDYDGAQADIARARAALPRDADVAIRHARSLLALGRTDAARAALSAALSVAPRLRRDPLVRGIARSAHLEMDR